MITIKLQTFKKNYSYQNVVTKFQIIYLDTGQQMRSWCFLHYQETKAHTKMRIRADSPEPSLLTYTKYGCQCRLTLQFRSLLLLHTSVWTDKGDF